MSIYKVGTSADTWKFAQAYEAMKDGDTIEFENGTLHALGAVSIKKNITLAGHFHIEEDGTKMFANTIQGNLIIDGAKVALSNLWFEPNDKAAAIWAKNGAEVSLNNCHLNFVVQSNKYALLADDKSTVSLDTVDVVNTEGAAYSLGARSGSQLTLKNVRAAKVSADNAEVTLQNTTIRGISGANAFYAKASKLTLHDSLIVGGETIKDKTSYPALWCSRSTIASSNCKVEQPHYVSTVCLLDNSFLDSKADTFTSIQATSSRVLLEQTTLDESLQLYDYSYAKAAGDLNIYGQNAKKIDVFMTKGSTLIADELALHRLVNPNIRLTDNAFLNVEKIQFPDGSVDDIRYEVDQTSISHVQTAKVNAETSGADEFVPGQAAADLDKLIGLTRVKKEIDKMIKVVQLNQRRNEQGLPPIKQSLHCAFMGNPGTGKTTVARLMGQILFENGALSGEEFIYVEATEADLVSNHVGETAIKTTEKLEAAKGGVLFIDEAYTLNKKGGSVNFGKEAIETILKYMEDKRDEIMIIFAGYTKEIEEFLQTNPGLASRVPNKLLFDDYSADEIVTIGKAELQAGQYQLEDLAYYEKNVARAYKASLEHSNARWIRNFNEQLVKSFAFRVIADGENDIATIKNIDIDELLNKDKFIAGESEDALSELNELIGLADVKKQVARFIDLAEVNKKRAEQGMDNQNFALHSLFLGNPGTGKTQVARILGKIFYQKDIIKTNKFKEVNRGDLVGGYLGQTAIKTREVLESALGGVLFIDEAYSLYKNQQDSFGLEAIEEILKFMEDHRGDIVIILAGYTKEMAQFMSANSGLTSRIPTHFDFEDYTKEEIAEIGELGLRKAGYHYDSAYYKEAIIDAYTVSDDRSNGRWARNFNERLFGIVSSRIVREASEELFTITHADIDAVRKECRV